MSQATVDVLCREVLRLDDWLDRNRQWVDLRHPLFTHRVAIQEDLNAVAAGEKP